MGSEEQKEQSWQDPDYWDKGDLWSRGKALFEEIGDLGLGLSLEELSLFDKRLVHYIIQFHYGAILSRSGLSQKERSLCAIAAFLPLADADGVEGAMRAALDCGVTKDQIVAAVLQTGCFSGFRKWALGARIGINVLRERGLLTDSADDEAWKDPNTWDRRGLWKQGWQTRDLIAGGPDTPTSMPQQARFDPLLPHYVIEFRFGEVTSRPELDVKTRQLCTLATFLATGEEFAAEGAMRGALNVGVTSQQIVEVVLQTGTLCGFPKWAIGSRVGVKVFEEYGLLSSNDEKADPA